MARCPTFHKQRSYLVASSAGRIALRQPPPDPPRRAANAWLATVAKPCSSVAQREQQVGDAVRARQVGVVDAHAEAVHAPAAGAHEQRARLAHEPDAERAALEHEPGAARAARARRGRRGRRAARARSARRPRGARRGRTTLAPRLAYSSGMTHAWTSAIDRHRERATARAPAADRR